MTFRRTWFIRYVYCLNDHVPQETTTCAFAARVVLALTLQPPVLAIGGVIALAWGALDAIGAWVDHFILHPEQYRICRAWRAVSAAVCQPVRFQPDEERPDR